MPLRRSLLAFLAFLGLLAMATCLGCGARTELSGTEAAPPDERSGFVVRMTVFVDAQEHDWAAADETLIVEVEDSDGQPFTDAIVHAGPVGDTPLVPFRENTKRYEMDHIGYTQTYAISVTRGAEHAEGTVAGPPPYAAWIDPDPMQVGAPATVRWEPSEPDMAVNVQVFGHDTVFNFDGEVPELGAYEIPAEVFSVPGVFGVLVTKARAKSTPLGMPHSYGTVAMFDYHSTHAE